MTNVGREPSPLRTPKAGGRFSPPRRKTVDATSNVASAATTGGRASPERQRRKQPTRTGSPLHSRAAPPAADNIREGRPRRALSRNPSPEATNAVLRDFTGRGSRRGGSLSVGLMEETGVRVGCASPTGA